MSFSLRALGSSPIVRTAASLLTATVVIAVVAWLMSWLLAPAIPETPRQRSAEEIAAVRALRQPFDMANPPRVVDPSATVAARFDPPSLAPLVASGELPPVHERTGPEPAVLDTLEGDGAYGGALSLLNVGPNQLGSFGPTTLLRWSPQGRPVVPWLAKSWSVSPDARIYSFTLRAGLRWSDGEPFTTEDIRYHLEDEVGCAALNMSAPVALMVSGTAARLEIVDARTFRLHFPAPHAAFPELCATARGMDICASPAHYLKAYHPILGDQALIAREMAERGQQRAIDLYRQIKRLENPAHPRLWPWVYRHYQPTPPYSFVRNPYYFAVDRQGRQLPYVDQLVSQEVNRELAITKICAGEVHLSVQKGTQLPLLMEGRERGGFTVRRWLRADRSDAMVHINQNRREDAGDPASSWRIRYLGNADFRRALSLAIDRQEIIQAVYGGETIPAQVSPGPTSQFHNAAAMTAYTAHDVAEANRLLDRIGLDRRGLDGMRMYPDGTTMTFFLAYPEWFNAAVAHFLTSHWADVGVRVLPRPRNNGLFYAEKNGLQHDLSCFTGNNETMPIIEPRCHLPLSTESNFAIGWARWYQAGGAATTAVVAGIAPPLDHPIRESLKEWEKLRATSDPVAQKAAMDRILTIAADQVWTIGICDSPDYVVAVRSDLRGLPQRAIEGYDYLSPSNQWPEQWSLRSAQPASATVARRAITTTTDTGVALRAKSNAAAPPPPASSGDLLGTLLRWSFVLIAVGALALVSLRHPFILRRLLIMIPTLAVISMIVFALINAPPGDFITSKIMELQAQGAQLNQGEIDSLRSRYHLDDPLVTRYLRWVGALWFWDSDKGLFNGPAGLLQGNLGVSMENGEQVNRLLGDRILLTVIMSLGAILLTWVVAIPVGMYSAVRQYSLGDYTLSVITFLGMCIPQFLLALILLHLGQSWFGVSLTGLLSPQYASQAGWSFAKMLDLLAHLWVPVFILTFTSTAGLVRVMRANMLDELRRPYVTTARAKGVRPLKLLIKYPLRLALNPFVSGIGHVFPALVSGGAILSIVLSLPTIGPVQFKAMLNGDTYYAGSVLMLLSTLGVLGTLVSDLLLVWLDPRIRLDGESR